VSARHRSPSGSAATEGDTIQPPERRYLRRGGERNDARNDPAGHPAGPGSDDGQDYDLGDQDPARWTPYNPAGRRPSQYLSERHSEHERCYGRNVQKRFPSVACLSVHAKQHDVPG
jgi:hypothetical protein